jgi:hypothetical protein
MNSPLVCVVLLNWRNSEDTLSCLAQLAVSTYSRIRVVVVDNGSGDDSITYIQSTFPNVTVIASPYNRGFAGGMNQGIQYALAQGSDYVLLLNSDVTFSPSMISDLIVYAEVGDKLALYSPKLYRAHAPRTLLRAFDSQLERWIPAYRRWVGVKFSVDESTKPPFFWVYGVALTRGGFRLHGEGVADWGQFDSCHVDLIYGCALLLSRALLRRVGLLDERFFFFAEDLDYCLRVHDAGGCVRIVPHTAIVHALHGSTKHNSGYRQFLSARARMLLFRKHYRRFYLPLLLLNELGEVLRIMLISLRYRDVRAAKGYLRGLLVGLTLTTNT